MDNTAYEHDMKAFNNNPQPKEVTMVQLFNEPNYNLFLGQNILFW